VPRFFVVDAFTDRPMCGNPAVIVLDGGHLGDRAMRDVAAEFRMEAGFVLPASNPGERRRRMRFFTPAGEVDVSGHVTVAAYAALEAASGREVLETRAGDLEVEIEATAGQAPWVTLGLGKPIFGAALDRREVLAALRATAAVLGSAAPRVITCGVPLAVCAVEDARVLAALRPDMQKLAAFSRQRGILGLVVFARPGLHPASALTVRFFFPAVGPEEDIVSGAALAAACAFGVKERLLTCVGETVFQTDQGHSLGRPNQAHVIVRAEAGQLAEIRVKGRGVVVATGEIRV
jgi:trans-2,3-dihydro-3-hydroxyanthranilate isomerase